MTKHQEENTIGELYIICLMLMYEALMHLILNQYHVESQLNASNWIYLPHFVTQKQIPKSRLHATTYKELEDDPAIDGLINSTFKKIEKTNL